MKFSVLGSAAVALPWQQSVSARSRSRLDEDDMPRPYTVPFATPPVLQPVRRDATTDYYRIEQRQVVAEILPGIKTPLFGYNGLVPGPTIKATQGRRTVVRQVNALPDTHPTWGYVPWTSTHLHGSPSEPQYDGYASDISMPGQWKDYVYPNTCSARTMWYHDHGVHQTTRNVYMGLYAQYLLTDPVEAALPLPRGRYDVPLILGDAIFEENGALMFDHNDHSGVYGDVNLVNGRPWPVMKVEQRKYRFRVLNGAIARGYRLALSNQQPFSVIATDAGLVDRPRRISQLLIGMAERYEIVVDFSAIPAGQSIDLVNLGVKNAPDEKHTGKVMRFTVTGPATDRSGNEVPEVLLATPHPAMTVPVSAAVKTRRMRVKKEREPNVWAIDGKTWQDVVASNFELVVADPEPGDVEIWEIENSSGGWFHPMHLHFVDFRVLSRNGKPPRPEERGPKDTVYVGEGQTVKVLVKFGERGGQQGRYMIHCHNLAHEDHDMMVQFQIGEHDASVDPIARARPSSGPETPL